MNDCSILTQQAFSTSPTDSPVSYALSRGFNIFLMGSVQQKTNASSSISALAFPFLHSTWDIANRAKLPVLDANFASPSAAPRINARPANVGAEYSLRPFFRVRRALANTANGIRSLLAIYAVRKSWSRSRIISKCICVIYCRETKPCQRNKASRKARAIT